MASFTPMILTDLELVVNFFGQFKQFGRVCKQTTYFFYTCFNRDIKSIVSPLVVTD